MRSFGSVRVGIESDVHVFVSRLPLPLDSGPISDKSSQAARRGAVGIFGGLDTPQLPSGHASRHKNNRNCIQSRMYMFSLADFRYRWILDLLAIKALRRHGGGLSDVLADCIPLSYSKATPVDNRILEIVYRVEITRFR